MDCGTCREALSARLDGEASPVPSAEVDTHLETCPDCPAWYDAAAALNRRVRVREFVATPDLVDRVLAEHAPAPRRKPVARLLLAGVGLVQLLLAVAQLFGTSVHGAHGQNLTGHLISEGAAWNLALGLAMLAAAWQTRRASGLLPAVAVFVGALVVFSVVEAVTVGVPATRLLSHIPLFAGVALLYLVQQEHRREGDPRPSARVESGHEPGSGVESGADSAEGSGSASQQSGDGRRWLRPAGQDQWAA